MPGCRSLSEVLAARGGVLLNRDSPQAAGLLYWLTPHSALPIVSTCCRKVTGTFTGDAKIAIAPFFGRGLYFDGTGDSITLDDLSPFTVAPGESRSITAWVQTYGTPGNASIFSGRDSAVGNTVFDLQLGFNGVNNNGTGIPSIIVRADDGGGLQYTNGTSVLNDDKPHLVGGVLRRTSGTSYLSVYADGREEGIVSAAAWAQPITPTPSYAAIGDEILNAAITNMAGWIYDLRSYDRALSQGEWLALYDHRTRFDLFWRKRRSAPKAPSASGAMVAALTGGGTSAGTLTGSGALAAPLTGAGAAAGTLTGSGALASGLTGAGALDGTLAGAGALASGLTGTGTLTGTFSGTAPIAADLSGSGALAGTLTGAAALAAGLSGAGAITATLNGERTVAFTGSATLSGTLLGAGAMAVALTGTGTLAGAFPSAAAPPPDSAFTINDDFAFTINDDFAFTEGP